MRIFLGSCVIGLIPFLLAQLMPGKRWLLGYGVLFAAAYSFFWYWWIQIERVDDPPFLMLGIVLPALILGTVSGAVGFVTRGATLYLHSQRYGGLTLLAVTVGGFLAIFPLAASPFVWNAWNKW